MKISIVSVAFLSVLLTSGIALTDPRIEIHNNGGAVVHFPNGFEELHDVTYVSDANPHIYVKQGRAHGSAEWRNITAKDNHPFPSNTPPNITIVNGDHLTDWECTMVDGAGRVWIAKKWRAYVTVGEHSEHANYLYWSFRCWDGVQQTE